MAASQGLIPHSPFERLLAWCFDTIATARCRPRPRRKKAPGADEDLAKVAIEAAERAEAEGDPEQIHRCSYKLIRSDLFERAWQLRVRAAEMAHPSPIPQWTGEDLADKTILVRAYAPKNRIGEEIRLARFIAPAANCARRCIVLAEPRLVPLLARSFPTAEMRPRGVDDAAAFAEADVCAYYETIAFYTAKNAEEMRRSFVPLRADRALAETLRQRYKALGDGPLVGISWGSSNGRKVLPDLQSWAPLLELPSARFVSLQYGDVGADLEVLQRLAGGRITQDPGIDQLVDLDAFAAQIAALDAVVSISNTAVDLAGMLQRPTVHIRDNHLSSAVWPRSGPTPFFPDMVMLYKEDRAWSEVLAEARRHVEEMVAASG